MFKVDWDAVQAYASPFILTVVALYSIWKDKKHYRERAWEERGTGLRRFLKRYSVEILYAITLFAAFLGTMEIHGTRHAALQDKARALADQRASEKQIADLQSEVKAGNEILQDQRVDFLKQFTQMSNRVSELQTSIKTADLQQEASQLRSELEATRKSMETPKATLSFSFADGESNDEHVITTAVEKGVVNIPFRIVNHSAADALDGAVNIRACDACKIVGTPQGFTKLDGEPDNERSLNFAHIFANSNTPTMHVTISPPPNTPGFVMGILYRCRTCVVTKMVRSSVPSIDLGTVMIKPQ